MSPTEVDLARSLFSLLARAPWPRLVPFNGSAVAVAVVVVVVMNEPSLCTSSRRTVPLLLPVLAFEVNDGDETTPRPPLSEAAMDDRATWVSRWRGAGGRERGW